MNKSWGGNLIIGTLVDWDVTSNSERKEFVDESIIDEESKTEKSKSLKSFNNWYNPSSVLYLIISSTYFTASN